MIDDEHDTQTEVHYPRLRRWAHGLLPLEAATELLIQSGYAQSDRPWMRWDEQEDRYWVDFAAIPDLIGGMSSGEKRVLRIVASLGSAQDHPVLISLEDELPGLDRCTITLVLAAIAHAAGMRRMEGHA